MDEDVAGGCPKRMTYGPCGGVRADSSCEMDTHRPCAFLAGGAEIWSGPAPEVSPTSALLNAIRQRPVVVTDLTLPAFDAEAIARLTAILRACCDALLVGEHQNRPDFPPTLMASLILASGGNPWVTLTCRDRNRLVLEQDLAGLRVAGADGVLCVTGDGRAHGIRPGVTQVFDLDGTQLAALANHAGHAVAVPEAPDSAPRHVRPARLVQKQRAGAHLAILNHVARPADVATFVHDARELGLTIPVIAAVAVFTDERSAQVLLDFPGLHLDADQVADVLAAGDPVAAGVELAVAEAHELLSIDGVGGVNLSGLASGQGETAGAHIKAEIGARILAAA